MTVQEMLYSELRKAGMTHAGACAVLGNVQHESAFIPNNVEDRGGISDAAYTAAVDNGSYARLQFSGDRLGYGLAQWTYGSRKTALYDFWRQSGKSSIGDAEMQIAFLIKEMKEQYPIQWNLCCTSDDLYGCTWELLDRWENPAEKQNNMVRRYESAQTFSRQFENAEPAEETKKMTEQEAIEKVLNLARSEIGYHEQGDNWTKYAQDLDRTNWYNGPKNGFAWCDIWYDWLFWKCFGDPLGREMICQPTGSAGAGCLYSAEYYKSAGRWRATNPEPGDQIFFTYAPGEYSHTGIVESVSNGTVTTIEGNSSDQVARRQYTLWSSNIAGYGRPRWELVSGAQPGPDPTPTPSPSPGGFDRILKKGMRGDDVRRMQEMLLKLGYGKLLEPDGADGDFGRNTYNAVVQFQTENGLYIDGEAGPDTLGKMQELIDAENQEAAKSQEAVEQNQNGSEIPKIEDMIPEIGVRTIRNGDKGNTVKLAQSCLSCLGFSVSIDGIFGNEFEKKIRQFQTDKSLEVDGVVGEETWKQLLNIPYLK